MLLSKTDLKQSRIANIFGKYAGIMKIYIAWLLNNDRKK